MGKGYKTESEAMNCQTENLFILDRLIQKNEDDYKDVLDILPGIFHVNDADDLSIRHANTNMADKYGLNTEDIEEMGTRFLDNFVHPDTLKYEVPKVMDFYDTAEIHDSFAFFQKIRVSTNEDFFPVFTVTKPLKEHNLLITSANIVSEIGELATKLERVLGEQQFIRKNLKAFYSLTKRELQILTLLAKGNNNPAISEQLFISRHTVEKHRKNMNKKLGIKNFADLFAFAQAFDLI
jgi:DNA-binding CsgD family transcriptional regulator